MRILYDLVFFIFSIFYLPVFFLKGKFNRESLSRFGVLPKEAWQRLGEDSQVLWVHAVSVGEIGLAVGFLNRIRDEYAGVQFLITTTTTAGHEVARKIKSEEDLLLYFPADFRFAVRSFVDRVRPWAVVFFETEIWPNLLWELSSRRIPALILNGRISDKAHRGYRRVRFLLKRVLSCVAAVGAQDERMRERFISLGTDPARVTLTANLKFDWAPSQKTLGSMQRLRFFCRRPG